MSVAGHLVARGIPPLSRPLGPLSLEQVERIASEPGPVCRVLNGLDHPSIIRERGDREDRPRRRRGGLFAARLAEKMPLEPEASGILIALGQEMPELPTHEPHEEPARIPRPDDPSVLGSGYEFQSPALRVAHQVEPHGFRVEREQPPGIPQVGGNHVAERRRILSPLPL